ncbi:MAG: class II D-tagatose-bisphosphate aldolase, non-catalytic subunit [Sphingomonadales bacterium]|nr:class II D-tagatose-bisphosphate aldolase, non-catalytic subunit [Sphingomonadales bacterium]
MHSRTESTASVTASASQAAIGIGPWAGAARIRAAIIANLSGEERGVYSVCCAHHLVIEAAVEQALADGGDVLVEATANQVNQFGGYTGMTPDDYRDFVQGIAQGKCLSLDRVILGGDHLGPVAWIGEAPADAMAKAEDLVRAFARARFSKIHLDCSMPLAGDPPVLDDAVVAGRAARLCAAAEEAAIEAFGSSGIVYVIGTEVPPPGGADETLRELTVTPAANAVRTISIHEEAFRTAGLAEAWDRVIALVVQPGVEFDHGAVIDYRPDKAVHLKELAERPGNTLAFEAHSTDYQLPDAFKDLVRDHFAVLKVGPALTFAMREALFALSHIEDELVPAVERSNLRDRAERQMCASPSNWQRFYGGEPDSLHLLRRYSLSDRIRYYWPDPYLESAIETLIANLSGRPIPLGLLAQYLPYEFAAVRRGDLSPAPLALISHHIREAILPYSRACGAAATSNEKGSNS